MVGAYTNSFQFSYRTILNYPEARGSYIRNNHSAMLKRSTQTHKKK
jgi:hypothetical protein